MAKWESAALCRDHDPEMWHPLNELTGSEPAKAICAVCPVRLDCLERAMALGIDSGIFGGLTAAQRRSRRARERGSRARTG